MQSTPPGLSYQMTFESPQLRMLCPANPRGHAGKFAWVPSKVAAHKLAKLSRLARQSSPVEWQPDGATRPTNAKPSQRLRACPPMNDPTAAPNRLKRPPGSILAPGVIRASWNPGRAGTRDSALPGAVYRAL